MAADLYATLGVRRTATPAALRKAFHKAAKRTHPDCGGSREEFERVYLAYRVLCDAGRRAHYDETGAVQDSQEPDTTQAHLMQCLAQALAVVLVEVLQQGAEPAQMDLVARVRDVLHKRQQNMAEQRAALLQAQEKFATLRGRFTVTEGPNLLDLLVDGQLGKVVQSLAALDVEGTLVNQALTFLKHSAFWKDRRSRQPAGGGWAMITNVCMGANT